MAAEAARAPWKSRRANRSTNRSRAEWGVYSKLKVPLHLYVPPASLDAVKRSAPNTKLSSPSCGPSRRVRPGAIHDGAPFRGGRDAEGESPAPERSRPAPKAAPKAAAKAKPRPARAVKKNAKSAAPRQSARTRRSRRAASESRVETPLLDKRAVPFLRLTRDRRGFENTFLMHADRPAIGRACCIGIAPRRASSSADRRSTRTRSARSKTSIPTSISTGPRSSRWAR